MKKNNIDIQVFALAVVCMFGISGCSKTEPIFTDAQEISVSEENASQDDVFIQNEADADMDFREETLPVVVHICGAVKSPGVYELPPGSRIIDAVDIAGGLNEDADDGYVNLADIPTDGEQIFIPTREEAVLLKQSSQGGSTTFGKININTADKTLLCTLPGIGDTRAADIIAYRQEHGGFAVIEDIMKVNGIKDGSFQKIKELIVVN